ncbi:MAG TPA: hypothetical protein VMU19_00640 [Bryobacteraceae bacterium]|nr:hypothetical protein [Bryobacteraceae bacterium]
MMAKQVIVAFSVLAAMGCGHSRQPQTAQKVASTQSAPAAQNPQAGQAANAPAQPPSSASAGTPAAAGTASSARPSPMPGSSPASRADTLVIPAGAEVHVRLDQGLSTKHDRAGEGFEATLYAPITVGGRVVAPKGTRFHGRVLEAKQSGRFKGRAVMELALDSFQLNGVRYNIGTRPDVRTSGSHKKRNLVLMGGGAGGGAAVGAAAGGGTGAMIGAGIGAAAGATTAFLTGHKNVALRAETPLEFTLKSPVQVRI